MDNVKITISQEKIYIKKGFFKKKYLMAYYLFTIGLFVFLAFGELTKIYFFNQALEVINKFPFIAFLIKLNYLVLFLSFFLHGISFGLAMYLEIIICDEKIRLFTPNYKNIIEFKNIESMAVTPYYQYKNFRNEGGNFREYFKSKCTLIFITKDSREYEWGYSLSYQKGMEIKKMIEERMALNLSKKNENV